MANHLDLEEQEQLDQLKHFWKQYGDLITWVLIAIMGAYAAWNGYHYWQRTQSAKAAALYEEVERAAQANDLSKVERAFGDIQSGFGSTAYAQRAGLLVAKVFYDGNKIDAAKAALTWVAEKSSDEGFSAVAKLRLAGVLVDAKGYDDAIKLLNGSFPYSFEALVADRKGDVLALQGKATEAKAEYTKAYNAFDATSDYRKLVEFKLNSLGVDIGKDVKQASAGARS
ncbi:MAG: tetratricopeptide repeat protein [Betaproteobacteria bacterium]|jgi:predicted negative regulator of RcsB-dependent stress response|nr:tetratricopeptide repeat protein [Betaproteobacteria bacterium]MBP6644239.1 tetratricopeptide repeat protein [Burkholderiaceae bacterium]